MTKQPRLYKRIKIEVDEDETNDTFSDTDDNEILRILKKRKADDILTPEQVKHLEGMCIELRHEVPLQHQMEKSNGTRAPSEDEKLLFQTVAPSHILKKGLFTPEEDQIIIDNWKAFCNLHGWMADKPKPFLFLKHHYHFYLRRIDERKKFVQFLADGLPNRTLYSVYHRFRNLYDSHQNQKYNYHEDQYIIKYIERSKNIDKTRMFADLAKVLNRTRASVWRRYRLLKKKRQEDKEDRGN